MKAMIILLPLLGLTWIIGIFYVNKETQVFAWIFAVLNSLQVHMHTAYKNALALKTYFRVSSYLYFMF